MDDGFSSTPLPAGVMTAVRIAVMMVGPYLIGAGWVQADQVEGIAVSVATLGVAAYGLWKTVHRQKKLNVAEQMLGRPIPKK